MLVTEKEGIWRFSNFRKERSPPGRKGGTAEYFREGRGGTANHTRSNLQEKNDCRNELRIAKQKGKKLIARQEGEAPEEKNNDHHHNQKEKKCMSAVPRNRRKKKRPFLKEGRIDFPESRFRRKLSLIRAWFAERESQSTESEGKKGGT